MVKSQKLLIHIAQQERWEVAVTNAINYLKTRGEDEDIQVKIVANADAVSRCIRCDRPLFDRLKQLILDGCEILICENAMKHFGISRERLPEFFGTVPAGIRALVDLQIEGWVYVRP